MTQERDSAGFSVQRIAGLAAGLAAFAWLAFGDTPLAASGDARPAYAAAVAALMAIWWIAEVLPIHWTALVPIVAFPALGVFGRGPAGDLLASLSPYVDPYIFLFAGGMAIAAAMQEWNLHRRIALGVMSTVGTRPDRLLLGFLGATAFVSMWISNTATAAMMLPIGLAVLAQLEHALDGKRLRWFGMAVMLAIAYGANIGGIGSKIGTAPNAQFSGFMEQRGVVISFLDFLLIGLPFVILFLPVVWWRLTVLARPDTLESRKGDVGRAVVRDERRRLGKRHVAETMVLVVFVLTATAWIFGRPITGWLRASLPGLALAEVEGSIALLAALVLMLLRSEGRAVLGWRALRRQPWETLLLLGGGFALAAGVQESGLSNVLAGYFSLIRGQPELVQIVVASLVTVTISAIASNTATIAIMLVVLADAVSPEARNAVLFAATIACSCDFALPAGTPPNAIVFGSGYVTIPRMARVGVVLDIAAALLAAVWCWWAVPLVIGR